jgi:hypothetical protein
MCLDAYCSASTATYPPIPPGGTFSIGPDYEETLGGDDLSFPSLHGIIFISAWDLHFPWQKHRQEM